MVEIDMLIIDFIHFISGYFMVNFSRFNLFKEPMTMNECD
jgi:hypothetical protein